MAQGRSYRIVNCPIRVGAGDVQRDHQSTARRGRTRPAGCCRAVPPLILGFSCATKKSNIRISTGIRELKNKLSHYVRQIEASRRVAVTAHGRFVAEPVPPGAGTRGAIEEYRENAGSDSLLRQKYIQNNNVWSLFIVIG